MMNCGIRIFGFGSLLVYWGSVDVVDLDRKGDFW